MQKNLPFISVIIPCLNEERFISDCLNSILANDYPKEKLEVLVVDGMSKDKTREIIKKFQTPNVNYQIQLLDNPRVITPAAMNIGIENARSEIIIKMDAHSLYEKDYISKCVEHLMESGADNVGGVLKSIPAKNNPVAKAIAISLSHFFGAGGSYFRTGSKEPREVDTVAFGCYWKKTFQKIGMFDEKMAQIEDLELNTRLRKAGGKIMLFPDIKASYYPSSDNIISFFKHNFTDGIWATFSLKYGLKVSLRHLIPLIFVSGLIGLLILSLFSKLFLFFFSLSALTYLLISIFVSFQIANRERDIRIFFVLPIIFASRHIGYGLGSIYGLIKLVKDGREKRKRN